jgi:hypothetical protein
MDSSALHELIAQVRGTAAALAEAEQRVASFTAELGPVDIHRTHIIAPTKKSMDRYDSAVFSYRVAILR